MPTYVSQEHLAAHLFMSVENVRILQAKKVIKKPPKRGHYDLDACREAYVLHLREAAAGRGDNNELAKHRAREAAERADRIAMMNKKMRGELVPREDCIAAGQALIVTAKARLLLMPSKLAHELAASESPSEAAELVKQEVHAALNELAGLEDKGRGQPRKKKSRR